MINWHDILDCSKLYNFHSHTQFCDGHDTMENFVKEAIAENFTHYGFSPHSPVPIESKCNISFDKVSLYLNEYDRLNNIYGDKIQLFKAMEIDYLGPDWGPDNKYFDTLQLDYKIGSVHFIQDLNNNYVDIDGRYENFKKKMSIYFNNDIEYVVRSFYHNELDMIEIGKFDIIGHFDKIGHNASHFRQGIEDESWYIKLVLNLLDAIAESDLYIEVNTKAVLEHNRFFPNKIFFPWLEKCKDRLIINSDAHYPELINAGRLEAIHLLTSAIGY